MKMSNALAAAILVGMTMFSFEKSYADVTITGVYYVGDYDIYYDDQPAYIVYRPAIYEPLLYVGLHIVFGDPYWYFPRIVWHPRPIRYVYYYPGRYHGHHKHHHHHKHSYVTGYYSPVVYSYSPPYHRAAYDDRAYYDPLPHRKRDWHRRGIATTSRQRGSYPTHTTSPADYGKRKRSTAAVRRRSAKPAENPKNIARQTRERVKSPAIKKNKAMRHPENTRQRRELARNVQQNRSQKALSRRAPETTRRAEKKLSSYRQRTRTAGKERVAKRSSNGRDTRLKGNRGYEKKSLPASTSGSTRITAARKSPEMRSRAATRRSDNSSRRTATLKNREPRQEKAAGGAAFKKSTRKPARGKSSSQRRVSRTRGSKERNGKGRKSAARR